VRRTRRQIFDATIELITRRGVDGLTMDAVAEGADIARSTLYRHWPNVHDLLVDTLHHVGGQITEVLELPAEGDGLEPAITSNAVVIGRLMRDDTWRRLLAALALAGEHNDDAAAVFEQATQPCRNRIMALVRKGRKTGELPPGLDVRWAVDLIVGPVFMNALVLHRPMSDEQITHHVRATYEAISALRSSDLGALGPRFRDRARPET
jgi:AcrR family transcriptional regulator